MPSQSDDLQCRACGSSRLTGGDACKDCGCAHVIRRCAGCDSDHRNGPSVQMPFCERCFEEWIAA